MCMKIKDYDVTKTLVGHMLRLKNNLAPSGVGNEHCPSPGKQRICMLQPLNSMKPRGETFGFNTWKQCI